jgi:hypothetical protein
MNAFFARALSPRLEERIHSATAFFGAFEQALFGGPAVAVGAVFEGIMGAEFVLPGMVDGMAATEMPTDGASPDSPLAVTPEAMSTTIPSSSGRRLRSVWSTTVTEKGKR